LQGANTLAYYENPEITAVKGFVILAPSLEAAFKNKAVFRIRNEASWRISANTKKITINIAIGMP
jgi:hypothetical protein